mgnify:CR=1 FL=1
MAAMISFPMRQGHLWKRYIRILIREDEKQNKDILLEFQDDYPDVLNGDNLADILKAAKAKKK